MRLILWHGYLLAGTGSNIYTQHIARAWSQLGHDVRVMCQEPHPERYDLGDGVRIVRPEIGPLLPVFVLDRYEGAEARRVADLTADELGRYLEANTSALAAELGREPADLVLANHAIMGGPVAAGGCAPTGTSYAIKVHGSELEYAISGDPVLAGLAREALDTAVAVYVGSDHIGRRTREVVGPGVYEARIRVVPPGVELELFSPEGGSRERLAELLGRPHEQGSPERQPDPDAWSRLAPVGRFVLFFGKLIRQKGVQTLLAAWDRVAPAHPGVFLVVVGFGGDRAELEALAGERVVFTGAMDHDELAALIPLADAVVVPSVLAEAFGMVAAEAAACGVVPIVSDHSGLAEVAAVLGPAARTFEGSEGSAEELAGQLSELLAMSAAERRALGAIGRERVAERWSWRAIAGSLLDVVR